MFQPMAHAPIPEWLQLFPKQVDVFNVGISAPPPGDSDIKPRVLCSGGRMTGKTIAIVDRIMRHLWETPGARAAVFAKTIKVAKDGGIWEDLLDGVRKWISAGIVSPHGFTFEYTTVDSSGSPGPRMDSQTRTIYFKIRNYWGGESELKLFSLEHDHEVQSKVKGTRFSLMWFSELSNFGDSSVMNVSYLQLRMKHLKPWQHLWIADTNPHEDGEDHWIYKTWYEHRIQNEADIRAEVMKKTKDPVQVEKLVRQKVEFRKSLKLIEIFLEDNIFLPDGDRISLMEQYDGDPGEYARNVEGKWVKGHGNIGKHFVDVFSEAIHVVGSDDESVGGFIDVNPLTDTLLTCWDLGDVNHAFHILEKQIVDNTAIWCVLDEHVVIDTQMSVTEFTLECLQKLMDIEAHYGRRFLNVDWSDSSSTDVWKSSGEGGSQAVEVEAASGGRFRLQGVVKPKHSVRHRVKILKYLLKRERLFVSKRCQATVDMFWNVSKGKADDEYVLRNKYKHPFDSLSYGIYMSVLEDPESAFLMSSKPRPRGQGVTFGRTLARTI
jgi:hypothetical protein